MNKFVGLCVLLSLAASVHAGVGDLTPTAASGNETLFGQRLYARRNNFTNRTKGDGTVSKHATIATVRMGRETIKIAIDTRVPKTTSPDVIRFDFTGKGKFDDKSVAPLKIRSHGRSFQATIGPITIPARRDGKTIPVSVSGRYHNNNNRRYLQLNLGTSLQGTCRFGEKTLRVRIIDGNNNLRCTDKTKPKMHKGKIRGIIQGDTMLIYPAGGGPVQKVLLGQSVKIGDKWYLPEVSADFKKISARPVKIKGGKIRINHKRWSTTLISEKHLLTFSGGPGEIEIPAGQYAIVNYTENGSGGNARERLTCRGRDVMRGRGKFFEVPEGKVTDIAVGSPIKAGVSVRIRKRTVYFTLKLTDASGNRRVDYVTPRPRPPVIEVTDAAGNKVYGGKMRYG